MMSAVKDFNAIVGRMQEMASAERSLQQEYSKTKSALDQEIAKRETYMATLDKEIEKVQDSLEKMNKESESADNTVKLNIGGTVFTTTTSMLTSDPLTVFAGLLSGDVELATDEDSELFIDRDPKHFDIILDHLRPGGDVSQRVREMTTVDRRDLLQEAQFYNIRSLVKMIASMPLSVEWGL